MLPSERLFAFLDDIYVVCSPDRVVDVYAISGDMRGYRCIKARLSSGTDGVMPHGSEAFTATARIKDEDAIVEK